MKIKIKSIKTKILPTVVVFVVILSSIFFLSVMRGLNDERQLHNRDDVSLAKKSFDNFIEEETRMLKLGLLDVMENKDVKDIFLEKDRTKLYDYVKPIFDAQKAELGVTHWLFHEPDRNVFLRVHAPELFGMPAQERKTFTKAEESKSWGVGMELGSVGFAQRVVHPYYKDNELIGYMEYGEDITPILARMKEQSGNDFAILGQKENIDAEQWSSFRQSLGKRDNYADLKNYVILKATDEKLIDQSSHCFIEQALDNLPEDGVVLNEFKLDNKIYVCGGFALIDVNNERAGAIIVAKDITLEVVALNDVKYSILTSLVLASLAISFVLVVLINRIVIAPLTRLTNRANEISEKNLADEIEIDSEDEIGSMSTAFNKMNERLKNSYGMLEEQVRKKTAELARTLEDMKKRNSNLENSKTAMLNILEDFDESKKIIEKEKSKYEAERDRNEGILRYLHSIGEGIIATDTQGKLIFVNLTAAKLILREGSPLFGRKYSDEFSFFLGKGSLAKPIDPVEMVLKSPFIYVLPPNCHMVVEDKYIPVSGSFAPIVKDGNVLGVVSVFQDITERYNLEKEKDDFMSIAAHQLRTPLTGIRWTIESLLDGDAGKITKEGKKMLTQIFDNNQRLVTLVNDLLDVSRINMGKSKEELTSVNICNVLQEAVAALSGFAKERKVEISYAKVCAINPFVKAGPKHIFQALENIISNSIKYTHAGGIIKTEADYKKDKVIISISDNGIGIPKEDQKKMFTKFFRASNAVLKETEGSGLGLNVVKSFIEESGGKIWFESEEGKGTTFFIELPVA